MRALGGRVGAGRFRGFVARFDWPLFVVIGLIGAIGLLNLYSATYRTQHHAKFDQQVIWVGIGTVAFFVMTFLDFLA